MSDLYLGITISVVSFVLALIAAVWIGKRLAQWVSVLLMALTIALLLVYSLRLVDDVIVAKVLPYPSLCILGNFSVPLVGFLVGLGSLLIPPPWYRRMVFLMPLAWVCLHEAYRPAFASAPLTNNLWVGNMCLQTTDETCGAAAAATILAYHHIGATEGEMAELCLTSDRGTTMWGLYRGLAKKAQPRDLKVIPVTGEIDDLGRALSRGPVILSVGIWTHQNVDPRYTKNYGWIPGVFHVVVVTRVDRQGYFSVQDPKVGHEYWNSDDMRTLWHGQGFQLIPEAPGPQPDGAIGYTAAGKRAPRTTKVKEPQP